MSEAKVKLGQLITGDECRDAVHVAICPVVAAERLKPGDPIEFCPGSAEKVRLSVKPIGIVDPFLNVNRWIEEGQKFFMCLYPAFAPEVVPEAPKEEDDGDEDNYKCPCP